MAAFKFRMATLLKLREATRDQRRTQLAQAYQVDALLQQQQLDLDQSLASLQGEVRAASAPGTISVDRLLEAQRHEMTLKAQHQHVDQQRQTVSVEIERRRTALTEANREVKVLENLRQRQLQRHQDKENRRDIQLLDEVAQQQAVREDRS